MSFFDMFLDAIKNELDDYFVKFTAFWREISYERSADDNLLVRWIDAFKEFESFLSLIVS